MNLAELNALPNARPVDEAVKERLFHHARNYRELASSQYKSFSGTDVAEAPRYDLVADCFGTIAEGKEIEATLRWAEESWRRYAEANNQKVNGAAKIKLGPRKGQSTVQHRWVSPDAFTASALHIRTLCRHEGLL